MGYRGDRASLVKGRELLGEVFEVLKTKQGIEELAGLKNGNEKDARPPISSTRQSLYPWPFLVVVRFPFSFRTFCILIFFLQNR